MKHNPLNQHKIVTKNQQNLITFWHKKQILIAQFVKIKNFYQ